MSPKRRKNYDAEFKRQAVALSDSSDRTPTKVEQELGLYQGAIRHWRMELAGHAEEAFPGTGNLHASEDEVRRLHREIQILRQERDILKKAVAIFSKPLNNGTGS